MKRVVVLALLVSACSAKTPLAGPTASAPPSPSVSASTVPRHIRAAQEAVYALNGSIFVYSARGDAVREVAKGQGIRTPRWVSQTQVSFVQGDAGSPNALRILDLRTRAVQNVLTVQTGIAAYGWSPDRKTIAYVTDDRYGYPHVRYFEVDAGITRSITTLERVGGREFVPSDQTLVAFSGDGMDVAVVYTPADGDPGSSAGDDASQFQIRSIDGSLSYAVDQARDPTMGVWSADGATMYYLSSAGLRSWKQGARESKAVLGSVRWFDPWVSPDGRAVAFDTGIAASVKVRTIDPRTGKKTDVTGAGFFHPVWAAANVIWVQGVRRCGDCLSPYEAAPEVFAVNLKTSKRTPLAIASLEDADVRYA